MPHFASKFLSLKFGQGLPVPSGDHFTCNECIQLGAMQQSTLNHRGSINANQSVYTLNITCNIYTYPSIVLFSGPEALIDSLDMRGI